MKDSQTRESGDYYLLDRLQKMLSQWELETRLVNPTEDNPFFTLIARIYLIRGNAVDFQFCFLSNLIQDVEEDPHEILQIFVELTDRVREDAIADVLRLISKINLNLPLGHFGVVEDLKVLYFKYNSVIDRRIDSHLNLESIEGQCGLILQALNLFVDPLFLVVTGEMSERDVWETIDLT